MGTETESQFQRLLWRAVDVAGGQKQAAAAAIGITPSRFSKLLHAAPGSYTLNARNCFRLAALLGEPPQAVLRAVGKLELAQALDEYAPPQKPVPMDPLVQGLLEALRAGVDPAFAWASVNALRTLAGLPGLRPPVARRPARRA